MACIGSLSFLFEQLPQFEAGYLYFFSSLAQAAAAFAALIAVFATYALQANFTITTNLVSQINRWLTSHLYLGGDMVGQEAIKLLQDIVSGIKEERVKGDKVPAASFIEDYMNLAKLPSELPNDLGKPLIHWSLLFIISLFCLILFEIQAIRLRLFLIGACVALLVYTTWVIVSVTRPFIQKCLRFPQSLHNG